MLWLDRKRTSSIGLLVCLLTHLTFAQIPTKTPPRNILITVTDENSVAVPSAVVFLQASPSAAPLRCMTDFAGRCNFPNPVSATFNLRVEKQGFYSLTLPGVQIGAAGNIDVTLAHQQEVREIVDVVESPPAIDPAQIAAQQTLSGLDVLNIPFPATHDYRNLSPAWCRI